MKKKNSNSVILFDGICVLCSNTVRMIIRFDKQNRFRFAALQSEAGKSILAGRKPEEKMHDSVILVENHSLYYRSTAILKITRHLSGIWPALYPLILIPSGIRDFFYTFVAKKRYAWFGRYDNCIIPDKKIKSRFIDKAE